MIIKMDVLDTMEVGRQSLKMREETKADISKTNLSKNIIVNTKKMISETNLREQEIYDYMFAVYFAVLQTNSSESIKETMRNFKHYSKKEYNNMNTLSDNILYDISEIYEKSALNLPSYKINRNQAYKNIFKNFKMKDLIMGIATNLVKDEFDMILEKVNSYVNSGKLEHAAMFIISMLSIEEYDLINSMVANIIKNGDYKKFEIRFLNLLEPLLKSVGAMKGYNIEFRKLDEYSLLNELAEESDQKINILNTEYTKIIDGLKQDVTVLEKENKELKEENNHLRSKIQDLEGYGKLKGKSVVLIAYKNKVQFEELLLKHKPKSVTVLDPFTDQSKVAETCKNADYVFHMTDHSSHTISNTLKSLNVNTIMIKKNNIKLLRAAIGSL